MPRAKNRNRVCNHCSKEYTLDDEGARHKYCSTECYKTNHAKTFLTSKRDPVKTREYRLRTKYGIDNTEYERMYTEQGGLCFICKGKHAVLHVDHCHTSGKVRKLLCSCCNQALGLLRENTNIMKEMVSYVENHC